MIGGCEFLRQAQAEPDRLMFREFFRADEHHADGGDIHQAANDLIGRQVQNFKVIEQMTPWVFALIV
jgi:hypothetical protein